MNQHFIESVSAKLDDIRSAGLWKNERVITSPQRARIGVSRHDGTVLNLCANNYLGLGDHPQVIAAAKAALDSRGYGLSSVRFICGTQDIHKALEQKISDFLGTEDTILYGSCFDANGGLFETLLDESDAVISDQLNHASIIDGVRLCKAKRFRYANCDLADLETQLIAAKDCRFRLITTDGVFSMDGHIAPLDGICDLAAKHDAIVHFDDCHATGFLGKTGRGTHEYRNCLNRIDLTTGTLGKAVGGASGGYTSGRREIIELLRQCSRPYLFSNSLAPSIVAGSIAAIDLIRSSTALRDKLETNTTYWREQLTKHNFDIVPGTHPITPVMFYDAKRAAAFSEQLMQRGVFAIAFSFPVVPQGKARIRTQVSAAHSMEDLSFAIEQFVEVRKLVG
jgi:glycine C-acetyltransferase